MVQPPALREGKQTMVVNCKQVWQEISNYIENDVDAPLRIAMDEHFATCRECRSMLEGTRNVVALYGDERMLEVPAGFSRRLEKKIAQNARPASGWSVWSTWLVPLAALLVITGGVKLASSFTLNAPVKSELAKSGHGIPPDLPVVVAADTKVFHVPGCGFIHNKATVRTLTAKEAFDQGYVPCVRCLRKYLNVASATKNLPGSGDDDDDDVQAIAALTEQKVVHSDGLWKKGAGGY